VVDLNLQEIIEKINRYFELGDKELEELYEFLDDLYADYSSRFLEALGKPEEYKGFIDEFFALVKSLIAKESRSMLEELALIAILDILASDLYERLVGTAEVS
jgi:hypothetical protein